MTTFDKSNQPISEQYRLAAKEWVELDATARLLEETKPLQRAERIAATDGPSYAARENIVLASKEWRADVEAGVEARTKANLAKVKLKWIEMRDREQQSLEATRRAEMKL